MTELEPTLLSHIIALVCEYGLSFALGTIFGAITIGVSLVSKMRRDGIL